MVKLVIQNTILINHKFVSNPLNLQVSFPLKFICQKCLIFKGWTLKTKQIWNWIFTSSWRETTMDIFLKCFCIVWFGIIWIFLFQTWLPPLTLFHFRIISFINNNYLRNIMDLNIFWRADTAVSGIFCVN